MKIGDIKQQSKVVEGTNPNWDQKFEFNIYIKDAEVISSYII